MIDNEKLALQNLLHKYTLQEILEGLKEYAEFIENEYREDCKPRLTSYYQADKEQLERIIQREFYQ